MCPLKYGALGYRPSCRPSWPPLPKAKAKKQYLGQGSTHSQVFIWFVGNRITYHNDKSLWPETKAKQKYLYRGSICGQSSLGHQERDDLCRKDNSQEPILKAYDWVIKEQSLTYCKKRFNIRSHMKLFYI